MLKLIIENGIVKYKWIKVDVVTHVVELDFSELRANMKSKRRNYIDYGICLDEDWSLSFLPEEINANAFIRPNKKTKELYFSEANVNSYIKNYKNYNFHFSLSNFRNHRVKKFYTQSFFLDDGQFYELEREGYIKGLRKIEDLSSEVDRMLASSINYLKEEMLPSGQYNYGYFPHFDKKISFYNNLRHCSSTYALIEGLHYMGKDITDTELAIDYIIDNYLIDYKDALYVFDDTNNINEIKLGQNAAFVFAVCEYLKAGGKRTEYLQVAQKVAKGMLLLINPENADTIHVLHYPSLELKEVFRVIYYDGEAALALLRLYQLDHNQLWLKAVKIMFDKFIRDSYWKYHDHWLGYCTNELVQIVPEEKYFEFGIRNVAGYLDFIKNRETTFPTFLEMLMSSYYLIQKAKAMGYESLVRELIDENQLISTIHYRADFQRTGFFYPELAMYFKNPQRILGSFFIKHHGYRVRIDDLEHYISGYIQYQYTFKKKEGRKNAEEYTD